MVAEALGSDTGRLDVAALLLSARYAFVGLSLIWLLLARRVRRPG